LQKIWVARTGVVVDGRIPWLVDSELGPARND
jgi:hypothetical protein